MQLFTLCSVTLTLLSTIDARPHARNHRLAHLHPRALDYKNNGRPAYTHMVTETAMVTVTNYGGPSPVAEVGDSAVVSSISAPAASPETTAAPSSEVSSSSSVSSYSAASPLSVVAAQVSIASTSASSDATSSSSSSAASSSVTAGPAYSAGSGSSGTSSGSETATVSDSSLCGSWATGEPIVHLHNPTNEEADYHYQTNLWGSNGQSSLLPFGTEGSIVVPPNTVYTWCPGTHWAGSIGHRGLNNGTRHELNFETPSTTWYNSDLEYGISNSMMKPAVDGDYLDSDKTVTAAVGTMDYLTTLNDAWSKYDGSIPQLGLSPTKQQLLNTKYLNGHVDGSITSAATDEQIREDTSIHVAAFFQVNFPAYVTHGSWLGVDQTKVDALANKAVRMISENQEFHIHSK